jgi:hypothetical protein
VELKGSWDTVLAIDLIEHIPQAAVEQVLESLERAANKRVVIATPNWPAYRGGGNTELGYNEFEAHLSYVSRRALRKRGYKIIGVGFGNPHSWWMRVLERYARKSAQTSKTKQQKTSEAEEVEPMTRLRQLRMKLETIPRLFPSQAKTIIAYKDIK